VPFLIVESKLSTKLFWKFFRPFWPSQHHNQHQESSSIKMGTVLSFSPKPSAGAGAYAMEGSTTTKEDTKGVSSKKHGMFLNALSWKKLSSVNSHNNHMVFKKDQGTGHGGINNTGNTSSQMGSKMRPDNVHPMMDTNKNIANALCHGAKNTSLNEKKLDLAGNNRGKSRFLKNCCAISHC
jgi:hypothetical protein